MDAIHPETQLKRWKGLITDVNTRDILCLINFSGGNRPKDKKDAKKHFRIEEEVYERIAMLSKEKYSKLPGSRIFVIRTIGIFHDHSFFTTLFNVFMDSKQGLL